MKQMSESLTDLAGRARQLEDSAAAARSRNRVALQARHHQLEDAIDREVEEFDAAAHDAASSASTWWSDTKGPIERQVAAMRAEQQQRKAEHKQSRAERRAEVAEEDAAKAIALAAYCLNAAE